MKEHQVYGRINRVGSQEFNRDAGIVASWALSMTQLDTLDEADAIDIAAPLVIDTPTSSVTHFDLVVDDTHHYVR